MDTSPSTIATANNTASEQRRFSADGTRIDTLPVSEMISVIKTDELQKPSKNAVSLILA